MKKRIRIGFIVLFSSLLIGGFSAHIQGKGGVKLANFSLLSQEFKEKIITLPYLFKFNTVLTADGIRLWTNNERLNYNILQLQSNEQLNEIARRRLHDMVARQYFAHNAPGDGRNVQDEAKVVDYEFLSIGENIALGDFKDDEALVKAWMDSPGHRENILSGKYTQIGIAVEKNMFEGENTWLAVQVFGRPLADCIMPSDYQRQQIEVQKSALGELAKRADAVFKEMSAYKTAGNIAAYNQKVPVYNALVAEYNKDSGELKSAINYFNNAVNTFNYCLEQ